MSLLDTVRSVLGIKPVKVGDLDASVAPSRPARRPAPPQSRGENIADIEVVPEYTQVRQLLDAKVPLTFVTGGAGTGKSTLIRYLRNVLTSRIAVVAPTGVAALNAGGVTINSLFRLPPRIIQPADVQQVFDRQLYRKLDLLIVDEVSMVRPDLLDGVDRFLRLNRDSNTPFGGVTVLLIGDLFQLPPVVPRDEHQALRQMQYGTDFFFSSQGISDCSLVPVLLTRVFRQTDPTFIALLNGLREGKGVDQALRAINARYVPLAPGEDHELVLTCTNRAADERNRQELARLDTTSRTYSGSVTGDFRIEGTRLPAPVNLVLKPGAQVMFTKNDDDKRWVNGTIGRVVNLKARTVDVEIESISIRQTIEVEPVTWEQYKYEYDEMEDRIVAKVVGRYTQLPLMLAWAVTIHKAQGKTLDRVFVDLGNRAFAAGQVYVALSRVRSLQHLRLARPIRAEEIRCDPKATEFYTQLVRMTQIE
ncbi:MAG: AAA family ATPase [Verrucomicrobia bacterium]|nr:AAA family ATPase [Verrucomicrobiota bacterium]